MEDLFNKNSKPDVIEMEEKDSINSYDLRPGLLKTEITIAIQDLKTGCEVVMTCQLK